MEKLILAIETSGKISSISILKNDLEIDFRICPDENPSSKNLLPTICEITEKNNLPIKDFDCFAVSVGPGSLTGIRVGIAVSKGLTFENESKRMAIKTLEAMALSCEKNGKIQSMMTTKKGSVSFQLFYIENGTVIEKLSEIETLEVNKLLEADFISDDFSIVCDRNTKELLELRNSKQTIFKQPDNLAFFIGKAAYNKILSGEYFDNRLDALIS